MASSADSYAESFCSGYFDTSWIYTEAATYMPSPGAGIEAEANLESYNPYTEVGTWWGHGFVWGYGVAEFDLDFALVKGRGDDDWAATLDGTFEESYGAQDGPRKLRRMATLLEDANTSGIDGLCLTVVGAYAAGQGITYDSGTEEWTGTATVDGEGPGALELLTRTLEYNDATMDVDEDGRFNELDADALDELVESTDPNHLRYWDFNDNDEIDADDVAVMQSLVDLEFDSGLLGDFDQDGDVDCDDLDRFQLISVA